MVSKFGDGELVLPTMYALVFTNDTILTGWWYPFLLTIAGDDYLIHKHFVSTTASLRGHAACARDTGKLGHQAADGYECWLNGLPLLVTMFENSELFLGEKSLTHRHIRWV